MWKLLTCITIISKGTKCYIKDTLPSGPSGGGLLGRTREAGHEIPGLSRDGHHVFPAQTKRPWSQAAWNTQPPFCFEKPSHTVFKSGDEIQSGLPWWIQWVTEPFIILNMVVIFRHYWRSSHFTILQWRWGQDATFILWNLICLSDVFMMGQQGSGGLDEQAGWELLKRNS